MTQPPYKAPAAEPFLRWAGGKRSLLTQLDELLPDDILDRHYVEPFLGGGAMFFHLSPCTATLCDANKDLIDTYRAVRDECESVIGGLESLACGHNKCVTDAWYGLVRSAFNRHRDEMQSVRAAWFIYLNRACFNGLWRVNKAGEFNVPSGKKARVECWPEELRACSAALQGACLVAQDFAAGEPAAHHDFVYFDPPYDGTFSDYAKGGFGRTHHLRLRELFGRWDGRNAKLMLSHTDTPWVRELYAGYNITPVRCAGSIGARSAARVVRHEIVIRNYTT